MSRRLTDGQDSAPLFTARALVFDFDGTIKDSLEAKADAFVALFPNADLIIQQRIRTHHTSNGGISRFEKIPLYMEWNGLSRTPESLQEAISLFSRDTVKRVVSAPWIPGYQHLAALRRRFSHIGLVSATPHEELLNIADLLDIESWFDSIQGWPTCKVEVLHQIARRISVSADQVIMIGDSAEDERAATVVGTQFINIGRRKTAARCEPDLEWLRTF